MRETHQKVLQSLKQFEQAQSEEQIELSQLKDELATYVEALKKSSMKLFRRGQYQECYEVLTLLVEIRPDSRPPETSWRLPAKRSWRAAMGIILALMSSIPRFRVKWETF